MNRESRSRILIVDDAPENLQVLVEALRGIYSVIVAKSGFKALELALLVPPPDLILLDIVMPEMDGFEVCRRLQEDPRTRSIPVLFITALHDEESENRGLTLGAVDFITKPFNPQLVKARVRTQLELKRLRERVRRFLDEDRGGSEAGIAPESHQGG